MKKQLHEMDTEELGELFPIALPPTIFIGQIGLMRNQVFSKQHCKRIRLFVLNILEVQR